MSIRRPDDQRLPAFGFRRLTCPCVKAPTRFRFVKLLSFGCAREGERFDSQIANLPRKHAAGHKLITRHIFTAPWVGQRHAIKLYNARR
jgi:hypothetical protein